MKNVTVQKKGFVANHATGLYAPERITIKSELVEIKIPAGTTKATIQLPDFQNLRNTLIMDIEAYYQEILPVSPITNGQPCIPLSLMKVVFLTLESYNAKRFSWRRPLIDYKQKYTFVIGDAPIVDDIVNDNRRPFFGQRINYSKSEILIADLSLVDAEEDQSILLNIFYCDLPKEEDKDSQATFRNRK